MRIRTASLTFILFVCICVPSVCAQQLRATAIYVPKVAVSQSPEADEEKIAQAVNSVLELRLKAMKDVQVRSGKFHCEPLKVEITATSQPREEVSGQIAPIDQATYQVNTSIKLVTRTSPSGGRIVELILDYDLVKYVRCKETSVIRRSEPISVKTAFATIVQMGDLLEAAIKDDSTPKKIVVDLIEFSGPTESRLKNQLTTAILGKLVDQDDFQVRNFTEKPPGGSDYIVTGSLNEGLRRATFVVQSLSSNKSYEFSVATPVDPNNAEDAARFFDKSATMVLGYIRSDRYPADLSDADVAAIVKRASEALCKGQNCSSQPAFVIPDLARLRDLNKATPQALALLGDAYAMREEYQKAAEVYNEAWLRSPNSTIDDVALSYLLSAADAAYKGQAYTQAAEQYDTYIDLQSKKQSPTLAPNVFVQAARSYRFANEPGKALERTLQGLTKFEGSAELDKELSDILQNIPVGTLFSGYETFIKYRNVPKIAAKLSEIKDDLAQDWAEESIELVLDRKFQDAEKYLQRIESLSVDSLDKEAQMLYRIARAVWLRDAQNDFAGAISSLEPYSKETTELAIIARYFLAETLYKRARSRSTPGKTDYERAAALARQIAEKFPEEPILRLLVKSNHELGKDDESRQLLEEMTRRAAPIADAHVALAMLCIDYIGDLICGERAIRTLGERGQSNRELQLRLASVRIFWAKYGEAFTPNNSPNSNLDRSFLEVELFYRVWSELALSRPQQAQAAFDAWVSRIESQRRAGESTDWVFATTSRALESDQALKPADKDLLRRMIAAMSDRQQPIPTANFH